MLLLPYLAGLQYGRSWLQVPLLVMWLSGWLLTHHTLLGVKTLRFGRYRKHIVVYGLLSAAGGVPVFIARPHLLAFAPAFAVLFAINIVAARIGQDRATGNGIASVTMASLMAMIAPATAGEAWTDGIGAAVISWLYLAGTVVYVKTMIRERGSRLHYVVSIAGHGVALVASVWVSPWFAIPFAWFLARAIVLARHHLKVTVVGVLEMVNAVMLLCVMIAVL